MSGQIARHKMEELRIDRYLQPDYCVFGLEGQNRDKVMENLYATLLDRGLINTELDWKSAFRANEVGNGIGHIQDLGRILKNAGCYVFVLKTPILWEQDIIRMLVMVKTKRDGDKDLPLLCRIISDWTSSTEKVEHFLKEQSWEVFRRDIQEECLELCMESVI